MHGARAPLAPATVAVLDAGLRHACPRLPARDAGESRCARFRRAALARHRLEHATGRRDEPPREGDALRLVRVEEVCLRAPTQHRGDLPSEVHCVAEACVHALPADGAMDMPGVSEQEDVAFAKSVGHAMVHPVGRDQFTRVTSKPA